MNKIDVPCGPEDLEHCHRIKGDHTITKFSCRNHLRFCGNRKSEKNIYGSKFDFNTAVKLYISESLCSYYRWLEGICKGNSMSNHSKFLEYVTLILWISLKFSPVVDITEIWKSLQILWDFLKMAIWCWAWPGWYYIF